MTQPRLTPAQTTRIRAAAQTLRVWCCEMLIWLAALCGGRLGADMRAFVRAELALARHDLRWLLAMLAIVNLPRTPPARRAVHPFWPPRGFARSRCRASDIRLATRGVRLRGRDLADHFARLRAVIDALDVHAARLARRLATPARQRAPRAVRPPAQACAGVARVAVAIADTS
jgi:hypothetical protein